MGTYLTPPLFLLPGFALVKCLFRPLLLPGQKSNPEGQGNAHIFSSYCVKADKQDSIQDHSQYKQSHRNGQTGIKALLFRQLPAGMLPALELQP